MDFTFPGHVFHGLLSLVLHTITLMLYIRESQKQWQGNHPKAAALEVLDLILSGTMDSLCSGGTTKGIFNLLKMCLRFPIACGQ